MKKNTNTNKNFNILTELRNKQIREIEDYDLNMDKRVYALEQLEYEDIYPDDNTIVGNIKLPPEVAYRYFVNASKFYSSIIYFTSEISSLSPESDELPNINSLKWSDFFESYGAFKAQIITFLKIPENFKDAEILKYFDNIVKALESFFSAIELYDKSYDSDYPLMDNYRQQLLEMYSFIESSYQSITSKFSIDSSSQMIEAPANEDPNAPTRKFNFDYILGDNGDDDDDDDDGGDDYGGVDWGDIGDAGDGGDSGDGGFDPSAGGAGGAGSGPKLSLKQPTMRTYSDKEYLKDVQEIQKIQTMIQKVNTEAQKLQVEAYQSVYPTKKAKLISEIKKADQLSKSLRQQEKKAIANLKEYEDEKEFNISRNKPREIYYDEEERPARLNSMMTPRVGFETTYSPYERASGFLSFNPTPGTQQRYRETLDDEEQEAFDQLQRAGRTLDYELAAATDPREAKAQLEDEVNDIAQLGQPAQTTPRTLTAQGQEHSNQKYKRLQQSSIKAVVDRLKGDNWDELSEREKSNIQADINERVTNIKHSIDYMKERNIEPTSERIETIYQTKPWELAKDTGAQFGNVLDLQGNMEDEPAFDIDDETTAPMEYKKAPKINYSEMEKFALKELNDEMNKVIKGELGVNASSLPTLEQYKKLPIISKQKYSENQQQAIAMVAVKPQMEKLVKQYINECKRKKVEPNKEELDEKMKELSSSYSPYMQAIFQPFVTDSIKPIGNSRKIVKAAKESKLPESIKSKPSLKASLATDTSLSPPPTASKFSTPAEPPSAPKTGPVQDSAEKQPAIFSKLERVVSTFNGNQNSSLHTLSALYTHNKDKAEWGAAVKKALKKANPHTKEKIQKYLASKA